MKFLKFDLTGKTAHFKKPDVNSYAYFSYGHIPKTMILGMMGAIVGLDGYKTKEKSNKKIDKEGDEFPEYYAKLQNLKISIVPKRETKGYFSKKIHTFNNSAGYASKEDGGNLVTREQWLEDVFWEIYLDLDGLEEVLANKLSDYLLTGQAVYLPYFGKNDHFANISNVSWVEGDLLEVPDYVDSLYKIEAAELGIDAHNEKNPYLYKDYFPKGLVPYHNFYEFHELAYTNREIFQVQNGHRFYEVNQKILYFI
jgi:CRISPR-associated protein Cas5h